RSIARWSMRPRTLPRRIFDSRVSGPASTACAWSARAQDTITKATTNSQRIVNSTPFSISPSPKSAAATAARALGDEIALHLAGGRNRPAELERAETQEIRHKHGD